MEKKNKCVMVVKGNFDEKIVVLPKIIFKGKRTIPWNEVEECLMKYVGEIFEIDESGDMIYVGNDFADEYAHSKYTRKLKGALAKTKANLIQGLQEIVEIADQKRWSEDYESKHKKKAEKGWYRYNTKFALPIANEKGDIEKYNIFQAVLIVRYASDNKLYLYDIQNIKKETSNPS